MIERIRGILVQKTPTFVVVECAGVGYGINISAFTAGKLPEEGAEVTLHTNLVVREDSMTLFGFADTTEKNLFLMLLDVNGVGPKLAQRILSGSTPADLLNMIASDNKAALGKIKGLGKKTCEQMTLTLKEKASNMLTRRYRRQRHYKCRRFDGRKDGSGFGSAYARGEGPNSRKGRREGRRGSWGWRRCRRTYPRGVKIFVNGDARSSRA